MNSLPKFTELRDLLYRTVKMTRDFILEEVYLNAPVDDLAKDWQKTIEYVEHLTKTPSPELIDLLIMLECSLLDFGITIRDPASGKEITFFAANNLGTKEDREQITEESHQFLSSEEGIPNTIPQIHKRVDGSYNIDDEDNSYKLPNEDIEYLGVDGEQSESLCENCCSHNRIPDSMLCHYCLEAGIICHSPEDPNPLESDPIEILAQINSVKVSERENSLRLLEQAGFTLDGEQ